MQLDTAPPREGERLLCVLRVTCVHGWHSPLCKTGSSQAAALGSFFGHLLERLVGEGDTKLFVQIPSISPMEEKLL